MSEVAAHLTDHVLPHVPCSRSPSAYVLTCTTTFASPVLQILLRAIRTTLQPSLP
jgi:hypothetical protein